MDSPLLKQWMAAAGIPSFRALARAAGVSQWAVQQVRRGQQQSLRVHTAIALAQALQISLETFLDPHQAAPAAAPEPPFHGASQALRQEYDRLQNSLEQRQAAVRQAVIQAAIAQLEPWLLQWPTVVHAVSQNPDLPAQRVLPLVAPVEKLVNQWGLELLAPVGAIAPFDPRLHTPLEGNPAPGEAVRIRYGGYRQGERILYRAKVSPQGDAGTAP